MRRTRQHGPAEAAGERSCTRLIILPILAASTLVLWACSGSTGTPAEIRFDLAGGDDEVVARKLQFYVHDVQLLDAGGVWRAFRFDVLEPWQSERVALVDLSTDPPSQRNTAIRGEVESGAEGYSGIRFSIGVPFDLNHADPLAASAPLDRGELFWTWQSGHKFLRAELVDAGREWSFHLGSTGCASASALRPPGAACAQPNVMRIEIAGIDPLHATVHLRLDELAASMRTAEYKICTGEYAHNPACADVYSKTGLQLDTGTCATPFCAGQRLWSAR